MPEPTERRRALARAGIEVIADGGMRTLTHRSVEATAGLPAGTASYHFRTRTDLVRAVLTEIAAMSRRRLDDGPAVHTGEAGSTPVPVAERPAVAAQIATAGAAFILGQLTDYRRTTLARYALEVEVAANPDLTEVLHAAEQFHELAAGACRTLGVEDAETAGRHLLAFLDGIVHAPLLGAASRRADPPAPGAAAAATAIRAYLIGLLVPD